jgi:hypothetical protein
MMSSDQSINDLEKGSIIDNLIRRDSYLSEEENKDSESIVSEPNLPPRYLLDHTKSTYYIYLFLVICILVFVIFSMLYLIIM